MRFPTLAVALLGLAGVLAAAQDSQPAGTSPRTVIRSDTRLVLVDTVVKDKKGNTVRDLSEKDFKVWEDGKEQSISGVTFERGEGLKGDRRQFFLLFFDNSTSQFTDQVYAREAAAKFIDRNVGPNKMMAVVEYGGSVRVTQNFTSIAEKLKKAVANPKPQTGMMNADSAAAGMGAALNSLAMDFGSRSVLLAITRVAQSLAGVPGRKTMVLFSSGFPLTQELMTGLTAAINACNRANVAVYPIDVRGLVAPGGAAGKTGMAMVESRSPFRLAAFSPATSSFGMGFFQRGGGNPNPGTSPPPARSTPPPANPNSGGTRTATPIGGGSTRPGYNNPNIGRTPIYNTPRMNVPQQPVRDMRSEQSNRIIPQFPTSGSANQHVLQMLAEGTGGLVILNTNDLLAGLEKIANDQNEYYILSYTPPESEEGSCHSLKVKVNHGGTVVRSRSGYCNAKQVDALAGNPVGKSLEGLLAGSSSGLGGASMQLPFFYSTSDTARVNVAMELPYDATHFEKKKGKYVATVNLLGVAYRNNAVAARFSDTINIEFEDKKELEKRLHKTYHYESQFEIAPGMYTLKVAFDSGKEKFGKLEMPLVIENWDGKKLALSGVAIAREIRPLAQADTSLAAVLLADRIPLVASGAKITPSGSNHVKRDAANAVYLEVYQPALNSEKPPIIAVQLTVVDARTGEQKQDSGLQRVDEAIREGSPMVPLGLRIETASLAPGSYGVVVKVVDSAGGVSLRKTNIEVE